MESEDERQLVIDDQEATEEEELDEEDLLSKVARVEEDVFLRMLLYLNCQSIASLEQTCHTLRNFISHSDIWKRKFLLNKPALERVEREQKINLKLGSAASHKPALIRLEKLQRNLTERKCRREKTSFYEVVGFNGSESLVSSLECSSLLVNEDSHGYVDGLPSSYSVYDLHKGEKISLQVDFGGDDFIHADIVDDSLAILRYFFNDRDNDDEEERDEERRMEFYVLELYNISSPHCTKVNRKSPFISSSQHGICSQVKLVHNCSRLLLLGILDRRVIITSYEKVGESFMLHETSVRQLASEDGLPVRLSRSVFRLQEQHLASLVSAQHCQVWDHQSGDLVWSRRMITATTIPPVRLTSLAFSHPHIIIGSSDGRAEIWNVVTDTIIRTIHHERDSGLNVGFRQLEVMDSLLFSLTACGWLIAWDWRACLQPCNTGTNHLSLWKTNTKHETPISRFVVNSTRIVTVEKHKMSCELDERRFVVVRDFWQFQEKEKRKADCEGSNRGESKRKRTSKSRKKRN